MQACDEKEPLQVANRVDEAIFSNTVKLDGNLVDSLEERVRRPQKRVPFRAFDVDLQNDVPLGVSVGNCLVLDAIEQATVVDAALPRDTLLVKERVPSGQAGRCVLKQSY